MGQESKHCGARKKHKEGAMWVKDQHKEENKPEKPIEGSWKMKPEYSLSLHLPTPTCGNIRNHEKVKQYIYEKG